MSGRQKQLRLYRLPIGRAPREDFFTQHLTSYFNRLPASLCILIRATHLCVRAWSTHVIIWAYLPIPKTFEP